MRSIRDVTGQRDFDSGYDTEESHECTLQYEVVEPVLGGYRDRISSSTVEEQSDERESSDSDESTDSFPDWILLDFRDALYVTWVLNFARHVGLVRRPRTLIPRPA